MLPKVFFSIVAVAFISSPMMPAGAGPETSVQGMATSVNLPESGGYQIDGKRKAEVLQTLRPVPGTIKVTDRCGSSNYYCTSPGFLYCCGNSTDGFYCAADVNGCTK